MHAEKYVFFRRDLSLPWRHWEVIGEARGCSWRIDGTRGRARQIRFSANAVRGVMLLNNSSASDAFQRGGASARLDPGAALYGKQQTKQASLMMDASSSSIVWAPPELEAA